MRLQGPVRFGQNRINSQKKKGNSMENKKMVVNSFKEVTVYEAIFDVVDKSILPHRQVKMYFDKTGRKIGEIDPLNYFSEINEAAFPAERSADK